MFRETVEFYLWHLRFYSKQREKVRIIYKKYTFYREVSKRPRSALGNLNLALITFRFSEVTQ